MCNILGFLNMVDVAQLAERLVVAQVVVGSSPIVHPTGSYKCRVLRCNIPATGYRLLILSGRSAARLARLLWEQEVGSSNLLAPTTAPIAQLDRATVF